MALDVTGWTVFAFGENKNKDHDALKALLSMCLGSLCTGGLRLGER